MKPSFLVLGCAVVFAGSLQAAQLARFVDYIESNGSQWLDTEYLVSPQTKIEADFRLMARGSQYRVFSAEAGDFFYSVYQGASGNWAYAFQDSTGNWVDSGVATDTKRHTILFDGTNRVFRIDGGEAVDVAIETGAATKRATVSLCIGVQNKGTSVSNNSKHRIYGFRIYEAGELKRDYRPCVDVNGHAGLYDTLTGDVINNGGTGADYAVGAEVNLHLPDSLLVTATPAELGETGVAYGLHLGLTSGYARECVAFEGEWTDGRTRARCTGWKLYAWDDGKNGWIKTDEGEGSSYYYTHPDPAVAMKLEWQLEAEHKIVVGAVEKGEAVPAEQWIRHGQLGRVTAAAGDTAVFDWAGDTVNASAIGQDLVFQVVGPRTVTPVFAGAALYVAEDGNDADPGTEKHPYASPKRALDELHLLIAAGEITNGTVIVGAGTYLLTEQLYITNAIRVVGTGWTNCVFKQTRSAPNMRVAKMDRGAKLVGVTCTGGRASGSWGDGAGAGIAIGGAGDPCTVSWCCISNNLAGGNNIWGAGINICKGTIDHCLIAGNTASYSTAGGSGHGGGIGYYAGGGAVTIDTCLICDNRCPAGSGGGIVSYTGAMTVRNTTIAGNASSTTGGGISVRNAGNSGNMAFANCLIADNAADNDSGAGWPNWSTETEGLRDSVADKTGFCVWGNGSELLGNPANCTVGSAMFRSSSGSDYHLKANSDAIGRGDGSHGLPLDLDGRVRGCAGSCAGCYEYDEESEPFHCLVNAFDDEAFLDETVTLAARAVHPPEGASLNYEWSFVPEAGGPAVVRTGNPLELTGLEAGVYTVWVVATDAVSGRATDAAVAETPIHFAARTNYVTCAENPNAAYPYATPETAATSVDAALACVIDGSVVMLDAGRHQLKTSIEVKRGIVLCGQGRDRTTVCRKSGVAQLRLLNINHAGAVVKGITFAGGSSNNQWGYGGGVSFGDLGGTVRDCRICGCRASGSFEIGAAVRMFSPQSLLENCIVCCNTNDATSVNSERENQDAWGRAGVVCVYGGATARNVLVANNVCTGASPILGVSGKIENCTVVDNVAMGTNVVSVAMHLNGGAAENCLFWNNRAPNNAQSSANVGAPNWSVTSAGVADKVRRCCWGGSDDLGLGCIAKECPQFVDAAAGNYRFRPFSSFFDAGLYEPWMVGATDADGNPRVKGKGPDIGCFECQDCRGMMLLLR